jgi:hypothetical protein
MPDWNARTSVALNVPTSNARFKRLVKYRPPEIELIGRRWSAAVVLFHVPCRELAAAIVVVIIVVVVAIWWTRVRRK